MRNSKKRLLSLALSLAMAFSLTVPALAEEEEEGPLTVEEGVAPISVSFEGTPVDGTVEIFMNYFMPELVEPFETGYQAVKSGTKFTVKHAGTDSSVYVYVFMQRFDLQTEHAKVPVVMDENWEEFEELDYYGKYYGDDTWKVLATRLPEYSSEFSTPDGNGNYWTHVIGTDSASLVAEWEDPYFDEVYPKILTPATP